VPDDLHGIVYHKRFAKATLETIGKEKKSKKCKKPINNNAILNHNYTENSIANVYNAIFDTIAE